MFTRCHFVSYLYLRASNARRLPQQNLTDIPRNTELIAGFLSHSHSSNTYSTRITKVLWSRRPSQSRVLSCFSSSVTGRQNQTSRTTANNWLSRPIWLHCNSTSCAEKPASTARSSDDARVSSLLFVGLCSLPLTLLVKNTRL